MLHFLRKIAVLLLSLFIVTTITFFLMHAIPGDPFSGDIPLPEEILQALNRHYGLDKPLYIQYFKYIKGVCCLDLGPSYKYEGRLVTRIIAEGFPISLTLGLQALFLSFSLGIFFGSLAALKQFQYQDRLIMVFAVLGISIPSFILATFLQYIFSMKLSLLPVARWGTFLHTVLPTCALSAMPMAVIARLMRSSMIETLRQDYVQTALAKGVTTWQLFYRHLLRNAILPVVSYLGPLSVTILTGSFVVEKIYGIPGLGQWFVNAIMNRDYTVIMGLTLFYSALLMLAVFIVDICYTLLDPRIKLNEKKARHVS